MFGEPAGHRLSQLGIDAEPARFGSSAPQVGPVVRIPGLVATIGLAVAGDLPVNALKGLPDPCRDHLDRFTPSEPISDLDPIILRKVTRADPGLDKAHAASVDEPQRPAAQRHTHFLSGRRPRQASPDQLEVAALDRSRHLVRCIPGHPNPFTPGFATTSGNRHGSNGRRCQASTSSATWSVILEIVSWDSSVPIVETRWYWMSRSVIPPAYRLMIISSRPPSRREPLGSSCGVKVPLRSRGIASSTSPTSLETVLAVVPLREFGNNDASGSPRS